MVVSVLRCLFRPRFATFFDSGAIASNQVLLSETKVGSLIHRAYILLTSMIRNMCVLNTDTVQNGSIHVLDWTIDCITNISSK